VVVSVLFSALLFGIFLVSERGFLKVRRQRMELARIQSEVSQLAAENDRLDAEVKALLTEPKAVERIAREDLGFVKPDEVVIRLPKGWQKKGTTRPTSGPR
jgi:cell division protein FtsB